MKVSGACQCGNITVEGEVDPESVRICHCTDYQTNSGSVFRFNVSVPRSTFRMTGEPTIYIKTTAERGRPRAQAFCPKCGSPIYTTSPGEGQQASYMLRAGILAQGDQLIPRQQTWFRSAQSWVTGLDAIPKKEKQS